MYLITKKFLHQVNMHMENLFFCGLVAEMLPSYDVEVSTVQVHEDFYAGNMQNDIALLQLKFPVI